MIITVKLQKGPNSDGGRGSSITKVTLRKHRPHRCRKTGDWVTESVLHSLVWSAPRLIILLI